MDELYVGGLTQFGDQAADPSSSYKDNFLKACDEYNSFGSALSNSKIRVEQNLALKLYGLKVHGNQTMLIVFQTSMYRMSPTPNK